MHAKRLGHSDLLLSPIGIGAWAMGGDASPFSCGPQDDRDSLEAIDAAIDHGLNWIDVSPAYGLGHAEHLVGRALGRHRTGLHVFTKCGIPVTKAGPMRMSLKAESIRRECEDSLRRLQREAIDVYQIHRPHPDADLEEAWEEILRLKDAGKVRWAGGSNFSVAHVERCRALGEVTALQPSYSVLTPEAEDEIFPYCELYGIGVIVYSPMRSGLLSGTMTRERIANLPDSDFRKRAGHFKEPALSRNLAMADQLADIGARHGTSAGQVAVAWTLRHPAVTGAIVGFRSRAQVVDLVGAATLTLTPDDLQTIAAFRQRDLAPAT